MPLLERDRQQEGNKDVVVSSKLSKLYHIMSAVPNFQTNPSVLKHKASLPITQYKNHILQTIHKNQVIILSGDTGSGKSTQVPQMILEHYRENKQHARIICTQPRRLSAVTVAERVAYEINESVGNTVGYQIRLESRSSSKTVLTYCTNGVLIRTLMGIETSNISSVTHLIIDEVHERDRTTDFLLIALKELLVQYKNLRLILMSATMDTEKFSKYFFNCPIISIPGKLFPVKEYFLEDILTQINYMTPEMKRIQQDLQKKRKQQSELEKWMSNLSVEATDTPTVSSDHASVDDELGEVNGDLDSIEDSEDCSSQTNQYANECIYNAYHKNDIDSALTQFLYFVYEDMVKVDYQHPQTGLSALMVASFHGMTDIVEQLLTKGANVLLKCGDGKTALDWAKINNHTDTIEVLQAYLQEYPMVSDGICSSSTELIDSSSKSVSSSNESSNSLLVESYLNSIDEESIDSKLMLTLIKYILSQPNYHGAILVFLPGYEDIVTLQEMIYEDPIHSKLFILTLHSQLQTSKQKQVFASPPEGLTKIILSTNIAETSITIDDIVYVIDCGKHKEKTYNSISCITSLQSIWISKACAKQRSGRAGRVQPGVCFHIISKYRFNSLPEYQVPEILRTPLTDLCLHAKSLTKLLTPPNINISDFLGKAIEPPTCIVTRNAVQMLKTMDALDPWEDLTELGRHLLDLPISPRYAKMLIYACVLKCLDPILTIVASLAYKEPFVIPMRANQKCAARNERKIFSANTFSDHMALLRAYQAWQEARYRKQEHPFCSKHFISNATMEMIVGTRSQLLTQLRQSGFVKARGSSESNFGVNSSGVSGGNNKSRGNSDMKDLNTNSEYWPVIKACLVAGLYPNLVRVDREHRVLRSQKEPKVLLHPSSVLRESQSDPDLKVSAAHTKAIENLPTDWLIFEEMSRSGNLVHVKMCTAVTPLSLSLFAGPIRLGPDALITPGHLTGHPDDSDSEEDVVKPDNACGLKLDEWLLFRGDLNSIILALSMRTKWNTVLLKKLRSPSKQLGAADEIVINNIVQGLIAEDNQYNLRQPAGIGQRPRSTHVEPAYFGSKSPSPTLSNGGDVLSLGACGGPLTSGSSSIKYFIIKLVHTKNLDISYTNKVWAFTTHTEPKVIQAFKEGKTVYLLFFNPSNSTLHGYARLTAIHSDTTHKIKASNFVGQNLNSPLPIEWVRRTALTLNSIKNSINTNHQDLYKIVCNDGQELQTMIGDQIKKLWDRGMNNNSGNHMSSGGGGNHSPYYQSGQQYYYRNNGGGSGGQQNGGGAGGGYYFNNYNDNMYGRYNNRRY